MDRKSATITDRINTELYKVTVTEQQVPITLASFSAEAIKGKVVVNWVTESEVENDHFLIYRDSKVIATVGGNGTTTETHQYTYTDAAVEAGKVYEYKISDVSWGGLETVHAPVNVEINEELVLGDFVLNKAFPNPFNPLTTLDYYMSRGAHLDLGVYNMQGDKVFDLYSGLQEAGTHTAIWDANGFPSGIYFVRMIAGDMVQTMKVVLMK